MLWRHSLVWCSSQGARSVVETLDLSVLPRAVGADEDLHDVASLDKRELSHRIGQPPVVGLARKLQDPTQNRDEDPARGSLTSRQSGASTGSPSPVAGLRSPAPAGACACACACASHAAPPTQTTARRACVQPSPQPGSARSRGRTWRSRNHRRSPGSSPQAHGAGPSPRHRRGALSDRPSARPTFFQRHPTAPQIRCHLPVQQTHTRFNGFHPIRLGAQ